MTNKKIHKDGKAIVLRNNRSLNPEPNNVSCKLFHGNSFFDAKDLVQVKYEMLRQVEHGGSSISQAVTEFGLSRPSFYQAKSDFETGGIPGLAGQKRGPKKAYKINDTIIDFIELKLAKDSHLNSTALSKIIKDHFKIDLHPRSIERAIDRKKKRIPEK